MPISKRTVAKEWLIFLALLPLGFAVCFYWGYYRITVPYFEATSKAGKAYDDFWNDHFGLTGGVENVLLWLAPYISLVLWRSIAWSVKTLRKTGNHDKPPRNDRFRPKQPEKEHVEEHVKPPPQTEHDEPGEFSQAAAENPDTKNEQLSSDRKKAFKTLLTIALFTVSFLGFLTFAAVITPTQKGLEAAYGLYFKLMLVAGIPAGLFARKGNRAFTASIVCAIGSLLFAAVIGSLRLESNSDNQKLAHSVEAFSADAQRFLEQSGTTDVPKAAYTGNAQNDALLRMINDGIQTVMPIVQKLNNDLGALETADDAFSKTLSADQLRRNAQIEARKRIKAQEVIASARADLKRALEEFVEGASTRYASTGHAQEIQQGMQKGVADLSGQYEEMFQLLKTKAKAEFSLYEFLSTQEFTNGAVSLNATDRAKYHQLLALTETSAKDIEAFRKQAIEKAKENAKKLEALR